MRYINNPPNPYLTTNVEWIGEPPEAKLEIFEETATRSIITRNDSPDIPFADSATARAVEPFAPYPDARFAAMKDLADAGIPVGLGIAPIIPGLSESHIPGLLQRAKDAGAKYAFYSMLRLPGNVAPYFVERLEQTMPDRAPKILKRIREMREGKLNSPHFGERMRGSGQHWDMIGQVFRLHCERLGLNKQTEEYRWDSAEIKPSPFCRPTAQQSLFD